MKFLAPFFNMETVANAYFAGVEAAYNATKVGASTLAPYLFPSRSLIC